MLIPQAAPEPPSIVPPTPTTPTGLGIDSFPDSFPESDSASLDLSPRSSPFIRPVDAAASLNTPNASPRGQPPANPGPFNFQPMLAAKNIPSTKPSQRRGHKYKHSSVSHAIFLEPPVRAPLTLPASLPIPTISELLSSTTSTQRTRLIWCLFHLALALCSHYTTPSLALTALSHLLLFDAMSALLFVCVDVLRNFSVWSRSTIRHPFGLERAEVLAGFAMSVFLLFMGFDVISHGAEHVLGELWGEHAHELQSGVGWWAVMAGGVTAVSALGLGNRGRVGRAVRFGGVRWNPSHVLTLGCSGVLVVLPVIGGEWSGVADRVLAAAMAMAMIGIGVGLVKSLGSMLLMSYGGEGVGAVEAAVKGTKGVVEVQEARFWQVNHGLGVATLKVVVERGQEERVRADIKGLVERGLVQDGLKWEVSVDVLGL